MIKYTRFLDFTLNLIVWVLDKNSWVGDTIFIVKLWILFGWWLVNPENDPLYSNNPDEYKLKVKLPVGVSVLGFTKVDTNIFTVWL